MARKKLTVTTVEYTHPPEHYIVDEMVGWSREAATVAQSATVYPQLAPVALVGGKLVHYDGAASDGSEVAYGVLLYQLDATGGDVEEQTVIVSLTKIKAKGVNWGASQTEPHKTAAITTLKAKNIRIIEGAV